MDRTCCATVCDTPSERGPPTLDQVLARLHDHTADAIIVTAAEPIQSPGPPILWCNGAFEQMTGFAHEEVVGRSPRFLRGPKTAAKDIRVLREGLRTWAPFRHEILNYRKDGVPFWVDLNIHPVSDETGHVHFWVAYQRDITAMKRREILVRKQLAELDRTRRALEREIAARTAMERQLRLVTHEVNHRANNLLATIQAAIRVSHGESVAEYRENVEGRISALAQVHNLLARSRWEAADLADLVRAELAPFIEAASARVRVAGDALPLEPGVAQSLAMVVHELTTNALKHGALAGPDGRVEISWRYADDGLTFSWVEHGVSVRPDPERRGVGSSVIDRAVRQLGGRKTQDWGGDGLNLSLELPVGPLKQITPPLDLAPIS